MPLKPTRTPPAPGPVLEVHDARAAEVADFSVRRLLPTARRRSIGPWIFADHFGPAVSRGMDVAPHPHCGLATVTWLLEGEVLHKDSLGTEQRIRPGQLNWMTAGHGISHSEEGDPGPTHGVQLWYALPPDDRDGGPRFDHHAALPTGRVGDARFTVLVGRFQGLESPARAPSPSLAVDGILDGDATLTLDPSHEHGLFVTEGAVEVEGERLEPGGLLYLGTGRQRVAMAGSGRVMVLGGAPYPEPLILWWNFVVPDARALGEAHRAWADDDGRFGRVDTTCADRAWKRPTFRGNLAFTPSSEPPWRPSTNPSTSCWPAWRSRAPPGSWPRRWGSGSRVDSSPPSPSGRCPTAVPCARSSGTEWARTCWGAR